MATIVGLESHETFHRTPSAEGQQIHEILTGHSPVFFQDVDAFPEIVEAAANARVERRQYDDLGPINGHMADLDREYWLANAVTQPDDPRVIAYGRYARRDYLNEVVYKEEDVKSLIRKEGNEIVNKLKNTLIYGPHTFGANLYFLQLHPGQQAFPGRLQFYRVDSIDTFDGEEATFAEFGDSLRYPTSPPFKRADEADIVQLVNDLQATIPSQPA